MLSVHAFSALRRKWYAASLLYSAASVTHCISDVFIYKGNIGNVQGKIKIKVGWLLILFCLELIY